MKIKEESGQVSTELILLIAGMIMVVLLATTVYKDYLFDLNNEMTENEVNNLKNKLNNLNNLIKEGG
ncbi:class III signal peptide-containing protein [Methanosphaera sp. ISO3-F5]|uniref:class III signal peptide-containing protein n=1 Tax=Methanosphaera sp. ISO3-F5 TaxID=1452353 RepID=UPI002B262FEA|nr:class III signal peptide-containing protein [Methanosphaera sp. ISO3-F5]WQH64574.1 class III signal peptide-containing protein [Methanosphaera sp. ISO3-F5]